MELGSHLGHKDGKLHAAIRKMQSASISCPFLPGKEIAAGSWPCRNPAQQQLEGSGLSPLPQQGRQESLGIAVSLLLCILAPWRPLSMETEALVNY